HGTDRAAQGPVDHLDDAGRAQAGADRACRATARGRRGRRRSGADGSVTEPWVARPGCPGDGGAPDQGVCTPFAMVCSRCTESVAVMKSQFFLGPPKVRLAGVLGRLILPMTTADGERI